MTEHAVHNQQLNNHPSYKFTKSEHFELTALSSQLSTREQTRTRKKRAREREKFTTAGADVYQVLCIPYTYTAAACCIPGIVVYAPTKS